MRSATSCRCARGSRAIAFSRTGWAGTATKLNEFMINAKVAARTARAAGRCWSGGQGIAWVCGLRVDERPRWAGTRESGTCASCERW